MSGQPSDDASRRFRPAAGVVDLLHLAAILGLPLAGAWLAGRDVSGVFQFPPPLEIPVDYLRFSWLAAGAVSGALALLGVHGCTAARRPRPPIPPEPQPAAPGRTSSAKETSAAGKPSALPGWGWVALGWTAVWWVLAWTRWPWFEAGQRFTFFPLWLGFIVLVNALTQRLTGTCLLRRAPARWLALFAASALFWWVFEWLNRFAHNWHYLGVETFGPWGYALHATACFSTVLPAVAAVAEWLPAHPGWRKRVARGPAWSGLASRPGALALIGAGALALLLTGAFPRGFYPALWIAPLALLLGRSILAGESGVAREVARGDWSRALGWMTAALICGFCWELWNLHSLAKWIYTVPGVERWHLFEMPLLGYAGYLPFGLECLLVVERLRPKSKSPV